MSTEENKAIMETISNRGLTLPEDRHASFFART
jgi:hypothetical protein